MRTQANNTTIPYGRSYERCTHEAGDRQKRTLRQAPHATDSMARGTARPEVDANANQDCGKSVPAGVHGVFKACRSLRREISRKEAPTRAANSVNVFEVGLTSRLASSQLLGKKSPDSHNSTRSCRQSCQPELRRIGGISLYPRRTETGCRDPTHQESSCKTASRHRQIQDTSPEPAGIHVLCRGFPSDFRDGGR